MLKKSLFLKIGSKWVIQNVCPFRENRLQGIVAHQSFGATSTSEFFNSYRRYRNRSGRTPITYEVGILQQQSEEP